MKILCPIGYGELLDKISILEIKSVKIEDEFKKKNVLFELEELNKLLPPHKLEIVNSLYLKLKEVNLQLWEIEDEIRVCEKNKIFDEKFISLARKVYIKNDLRFEFKNEINKALRSEINEVKSYEKYK